MDAITALTQRASVGKLTDPGPSAEEFETLIRAAVRAADHGQIRPWRFLKVTGRGLEALGELYCRAALADNADLSEPFQQKYRNMPLRAPCVLVVIASLTAHPKVPAQEQVISAGACAQNVVNAAFALGLGAMWRTGEMAYHPVVEQGLGLAAEEQIVGYIYLGTPAMAVPGPKRLELADVCQSWPGATGQID